MSPDEDGTIDLVREETRAERERAAVEAARASKQRAADRARAAAAVRDAVTSGSLRP